MCIAFRGLTRCDSAESTKKRFGRAEPLFYINFCYFLEMNSLPPIYFLRASGILMEPSAC